MRVLVCGSRTFTDDDHFFEVMNEINDTYNLHNKITEIIHGGARGADALADSFARTFDIPVSRYDAEWDKYGKSAGPIRNRRMLEEGKPDLVVAFLNKVANAEIFYGLSDSQHSRGTKNMIEQATKANVPVKVINV